MGLHSDLRSTDNNSKHKRSGNSGKLMDSYSEPRKYEKVQKRNPTPSPICSIRVSNTSPVSILPISNDKYSRTIITDKYGKTVSMTLSGEKIILPNCRIPLSGPLDQKTRVSYMNLGLMNKLKEHEEKRKEWNAMIEEHNKHYDSEPRPSGNSGKLMDSYSEPRNYGCFWICILIALLLVFSLTLLPR